MRTTACTLLVALALLADDAKEEKKDEGAFASKRGGFSFHLKQKGWRVEQEPACPIVFASVVHDGMLVEVAFARIEDKEPDLPLSEEAAKALAPTVEDLIALQSTGVKDLRAEPLTTAAGPAFQFRAEGRRRLTRTDVVLRAVLLKSGARVWVLAYAAPVGAPSVAEAAFEEVIASFQAAKPEADKFTSASLAFTLTRPEGWTMEGKEDKRSASISLAARDGSAEASVDARLLERETDLQKAAADLAARLAKELSAFEKGEEQFVSIGRRMARVFPFTYKKEGAVRAGAALVTRERKRVVEVVVHAADAETARQALDAIAAGLDVRAEDAGADAAEGAEEAMRALREGDERFLGGEWKKAQALYRKARRAWPRFGHASLMLARCGLAVEEMDEASEAAEEAWRLLPGRDGVKELLARCRARHAYCLAKDGEYEKAGDALVGAATLRMESEEVEEEIGKAARAFTAGPPSEAFAAIRASLGKVHGALPEDDAVAEELAKICRWIAGRALKAEEYDKALAMAQEGLKARPHDRDLKELVRKIEKERKERK